jgi:hypothetical protein
MVLVPIHVNAVEKMIRSVYCICYQMQLNLQIETDQLLLVQKRQKIR